MQSTVYLSARRLLASYEEGKPTGVDYDAGAMLVAYYMRFHFASGLDGPEMADGALKFGKRIRVLAMGAQEKQQRLFDICVDGSVVNPNDVNIDPETGVKNAKRD